MADGFDYMSHHTDDLGYPNQYVVSDPAIVPLRDPLLAEITRLNTGWGGYIKEWASVAEWRNFDTVFFLPVPASQADVDALAEFLDMDSVEADPEPVGSSNDVRGLKPKYEAFCDGVGSLPEDLEPAYEWLCQRTDVQALCRKRGYNLPWMR